MIRVGTSGFSYEDWRGGFYPEDLRKGDMLTHYGTVFNTVEVNSSYYHIPHPAVFFQMAKKTPDGFDFTVKLHKSMTHERSGDAPYEAFREALKPFREQEKLGCVLAQFPWAFRDSRENRDYILTVRDRVGSDTPLVVEFRHNSWVQEDLLALLRKEGIGFSCVDEPRLKGLMPAMDACTSPIGYVRFHSRDASKWWGTDVKQRYDYLYSDGQLREWVPRIETIARQAEKTYVFFNNCHGGQAAKNALTMVDLLKG